MTEGRRVSVVAVEARHGAWVLRLSCGHGIEVTTDKKPERTEATCVQCGRVAA